MVQFYHSAVHNHAQVLRDFLDRNIKKRHAIVMATIASMQHATVAELADNTRFEFDSIN
jgi:hypothetical protein